MLNMELTPRKFLFHLMNAIRPLCAWLLHAVLVVDELLLVDHRSELLQTHQTSSGLPKK